MAENSIQENNYMINNLADKSTDYFPGIAQRAEQKENHFFLYTNLYSILHLHFISPTIIRFRYATEAKFPNDFSYGISEEFKVSVPDVSFSEEDDHYLFTTSELICTVSKQNLRVRILNKSGIVICEDENGFHWEDNRPNGGDIVKLTKMRQSGEHFFGLGDKSCSLDLRGKRLSLWGSDTYGYGEKSDPLYKNIPFYIGVHHKLSYGIFFDNTFQSFFDFGSERSNVTSFWAQGGEMNYYFFYGPSQKKVVEQYTSLTGKPELPPLWALGFHQCKWSYYPESKVKEITNGFRKRKIPCDAIYLDIDYMDGFRCFTWNKEYFPDHKRMIKELADDGFKTIVIIDPGIKIDPNYFVYKEAIEKGYFCERADGPLMKGSVWPGLCNFPDYTRADVREWWAGLFKGLIAEDGIQGVWNDMNEPAVFEEGTFPDDVRHHYDGNPCSHRKAHNVYGMQMARATYMGLKKFMYPNRPFVITRSGYSGVQRYSSAWTGDNVATWEHLQIANVQCQRSSLSGLSFIGSDIGGFIESPSGELFVRWIQLGIFHPFCRVHSSGDHGDQEPWSFDDKTTTLVKKFIELRYQLLPYIYTTFAQYVKDGTPMLRPLSYLDQKDVETLSRDEEFGLGDNLLICPVTEPNVDGRWMYLPRGNWYYWWNDELVEGNNEAWAAAELDRVPLYVKAGAVIPINPIMQYVGEKRVEELTLHVYHTNGVLTSELYEDAGNGYDYESGKSITKKFVVKGKKDELIIEQLIEGDFIPEYDNYKIVIHGFLGTECTVDGQETSFETTSKVIEIKQVSKEFKNITLKM